MVYYFSGTGNSAYVAKRISAHVGEPMVSITEQLKKKKAAKAGSGERLIFVTPTYGWRIPRIVEEWIEKSEFTSQHEVYFVMTCGEGIGNPGKYLRRLCEKKAFTYKGCAGIVMPENYIAMFSVPGKEEIKEIIRKAEPKIERAAEIIRAGGTLPEKHVTMPDRLESSLINFIFYPLFVHAKKFFVKDNCNGCGKCAATCPLGNVKLAGQRPVWGSKCTHCMACICGCPTEAIEYGRKSRGKRRYNCPQ